MPEFHDVFWKSLFKNIENLIEFFRFLFGDKVDLLDFKRSSIRTEIYLTKKRKLILDLLLEVPLKNSSGKVFFLIEHKSVRDDGFLIQIHKYIPILINNYIFSIRYVAFLLIIYL